MSAFHEFLGKFLATARLHPRHKWAFMAECRVRGSRTVEIERPTARWWPVRHAQAAGRLLAMAASSTASRPCSDGTRSSTRVWEEFRNPPGATGQGLAFPMCSTCASCSNSVGVDSRPGVGQRPPRRGVPDQRPRTPELRSRARFHPPKKETQRTGPQRGRQLPSRPSPLTCRAATCLVGGPVSSSNMRDFEVRQRLRDLRSSRD